MMIDVVVVGAGAAGLHAAAQLARARKRVVLLEGRERAGGRILTERDNTWPLPVDYGPEFVHGGNRVLKNVMRIGRIQREPVKKQHWLVEASGRRALPDAWERIDAVMRRIGPRFRGSFAEWIAVQGDQLDAADRTLAEAFVKGFQGAPLGQMSARMLYESTKAPEEQFRIKGGYAQVVTELLKQLPPERVTIHLRTVVKQIEWSRERVLVRANDSEFQARAVLVTVPLGVLQSRRGQEGHIRFLPTLGERERLWRKLACGHATRIVFRMRADIWRRGVIPRELRANSGGAFGFIHSEERHFPVWWSEAPHPVLIGWTGGPAAMKMSGLPPRKVFALARRTLSKLLDCDERALNRSILDWKTHDWMADPLTRGAYSFSTARMEDAPRLMARPIERTIFFAGEATADPLELGTVHGALASGERAAREILK
ncbi:MAG TPA: NAD(P)/FAD-dependent oxidoreductase [Opitutus sp.]|nr:NAD(P)/FAD-dependent oxidoreductase [Opitutus sp.]